MDGRLLSYLTMNPAEDGGQWGMLVNLINKYGLVPKQYFPDSWSSGYSRKPLNYMINNKVSIAVFFMIL